jgi:hypothetical protein
MQIGRLREALRASPFRPFTLGLTDGRKFKIPHPEYVAMAKRILVVVNAQTDAITWVEPGLVRTLDFEGEVPTLANDPRKKEEPDQA